MATRRQTESRTVDASTATEAAPAPDVEPQPEPEQQPAPSDVDEQAETSDVELDEPDLQAATTWYAPNQQAVHADGKGPARIVAKGATAGIPGAFTPAGAELPGTAADVIGSTITATPATPWTTGQYVQTATPAAAGRVCWTGTAWVGGAAP